VFDSAEINSVLALTARGPGLTKLHVTHSKDETGPCEWAMMNLKILSNLFILNNMAEATSFLPWERWVWKGSQ